MKSTNTYAGLGLLTALSASLCCIAPVLALVAGTSGLASTFTWLEPLRPYLIGLTIAVLGFAWYQQLKPQVSTDCDCDVPTKKPFVKTKAFLGVVTLFALLTLTFPMYSGLFYQTSEPSTLASAPLHSMEVRFQINGMTCSGCEQHITHEVNQLSGIHHVSASYEDGVATVAYDERETDRKAIEAAIIRTGYTIQGVK